MRQGNLNTKCFSELWIKSKQSTVNLKNTAFISTRLNNSTSNGTSVLSWETRHIEIKLALCAILLVLSFAGNATILLPLMRFTTTRTVTNFFICNLAVSDLVTSILNLPLFALAIVCDLSSLRNKTAGWWIYCSFAFFGLNRVVCTVLLVVDQYFSIVHGLNTNSGKQHPWRGEYALLLGLWP